MAGSGKPRKVAIACQGGGSHAAFCAGALKVLLAGQVEGNYRVSGLSGTSGGAWSNFSAFLLAGKNWR